jgi:hypothetical protein
MKTEAILFSRQVGLCIHLNSKQEVSQLLSSIHLQLPKVVASPHSRQGMMLRRSLFLP